MFTVTKDTCETPPATAVKVTVCEPEGTLFTLDADEPPPPHPAMPTRAIPASKASTGAHRSRLRWPQAIPNRQKGVSNAHTTTLPDGERSADVVDATLIVSDTCVTPVPLTVTVELAGEQVTYFTAEAQLRLTEPLNPPAGNTLNATVPELPCVIAMVAGLAVSEMGLTTVSICAALVAAA
jgi:hypothetical protein